jgi:hypothetical protein
MGQAATLYRISQDQFDRLKKEPTSFKIEMTVDHKTFEQNFEGLMFLLNKVSLNSHRNLVQELFYPSESLGNSVNFEQDDFDRLGDQSFLENESVSYLSNEKIQVIKLFLAGIDEHQLLRTYDAKELNDNGIYPCVWHNDESPDQAFNRRHIQEGFQNLKQLFEEAVENKSLILAFVG